MISIVDNQPPEIRNCPQTVTAFTDKLSQTAVVNWTQPTARDNSDEVTVYQTKGGPPGSSFPVGQTEVRYQASDANNNTSTECTFFINVEGMYHCFFMQFTILRIFVPGKKFIFH